MNSQDHETTKPPYPSYIFRGHRGSVHVVDFFADGSYIFSGDETGEIIIWSALTRRPLLRWGAHSNVILGAVHIEPSKLVTHGRDHKIYLWQLPESHIQPEGFISYQNTTYQKPWMLCSLDVNALNFCALSVSVAKDDTIYVAVSNHLAAEYIDIYELPACLRQHKEVGKDCFTFKTGLAMSTRFSFAEDHCELIVGYESGHFAAFRFEDTWDLVYISRPHKQPLLSVDGSFTNRIFFSSAADGIVAKHIIPEKVQESTPTEPDVVRNTMHAGQQSLKVRADAKIFATAGWDGRIRVYTTKSLSQVAVLKWHKSSVQSIAFSPTHDFDVEENEEAKDEIQSRALRSQKSKIFAANWIIGGSKDGNISLWNVF